MLIKLKIEYEYLFDLRDSISFRILNVIIFDFASTSK